MSSQFERDQDQGPEPVASELRGLLNTRGFDPTAEVKDFDFEFPYFIDLGLPEFPYDDTTLDGWDG